ncbi:MAG TPA: hypothetical protein VGL26_01470 [Jatrophihabitans sp.]|jgi:hypothetical protein
MSSSWLATLLDQEQIETTTKITSHVTPVVDMPDRTGADVAHELGSRLFLRYLTKSQLVEFLQGSVDRGHWVTPTPISSTEVVDWLALFAPGEPREHALLLDPSKIELVRGPSWVRLGSGIEYYLPAGFSKAAILDVGHVRVR